MIRVAFVLALAMTPLFASADDYGGTSSDYASDDSHNHDGTHPEGMTDCGTNYMLPGATARLGSHSFIILGQDGPHHIIADHRSGTPPHNYHFILKIRLDPDEMARYQKLKSESKRLPAFTTIYFDDETGKKQLDRTFFCLADLPKIFGAEQKKEDAFAKLFPIRASLQKDADMEGAFPIESTIYPGGHFSFNRNDIEIVIFKYLPAYLPQADLRKAIQDQPTKIIPLLDDAPISQNDVREKAEQRSSYISTDGRISTEKGDCPADFYLKKFKNPKTIHGFLLLNETPEGQVLAVHYYDQAPHNFQALLRLRLDESQLALFRKAREGAKSPPLFLTSVARKGKQKARGTSFCMRDLRELVAKPDFEMVGTIYRDPVINEYKRGTPVGEMTLKSSQMEVGVNRILQSLLDPKAVIQDVMKR